MAVAHAPTQLVRAGAHAAVLCLWVWHLQVPRPVAKGGVAVVGALILFGLLKQVRGLAGASDAVPFASQPSSKQVQHGAAALQQAHALRNFEGVWCLVHAGHIRHFHARCSGRSGECICHSRNPSHHNTSRTHILLVPQVHPPPLPPHTHLLMVTLLCS